jgi:hypothetical protein
MPDRMRSLVAGAETLSIHYDDPRLLIVDAEDNQRILFTDGRKVGFEMGSDLWEGKVKWKKSKVVLKAKSARGRKLTETFELLDDGRQLVISIEMDGSGAHLPSVEFRRVYERVAAETPDPTDVEDAAH